MHTKSLDEAWHGTMFCNFNSGRSSVINPPVIVTNWKYKDAVLFGIFICFFCWFWITWVIYLWWFFVICWELSFLEPHPKLVGFRVYMVTCYCISYVSVLWRLFQNYRLCFLKPWPSSRVFCCRLGLPSYTQKIADLLEAAAEDAPDLRTYLNIHQTLRREYVFIVMCIFMSFWYREWNELLKDVMDI